MKKIFLFFMLLISSEVVAQELQFKAIIPQGSSLSFGKLHNNTNNPAGSVRDFKGQIWLKGQLEAYWIKGVDEEEEKTLLLQLVVAKDEIKKLPSIEVFRNHKKESTYSQENGIVSILNPKEAMKIAFAQNELKNFKQKKVKALKVKGNFLITNYQSFVECDALHSSAKLIQNEKNKSQENTILSGC